MSEIDNQALKQETSRKENEMTKYEESEQWAMEIEVSIPQSRTLKTEWEKDWEELEEERWQLEWEERDKEDEKRWNEEYEKERKLRQEKEARELQEKRDMRNVVAGVFAVAALLSGMIWLINYITSQ